MLLVSVFCGRHDQNAYVSSIDELRERHIVIDRCGRRHRNNIEWISKKTKERNACNERLLQV